MLLRGSGALLVALLLAAAAGAAAAKPRLTTTADGAVVNEKGQKISFTGTNWFGFNTDLDMPGNLTNGADAVSQDFATTVWRMRMLGFNSVRLPFRFSDLTKGEPGGTRPGATPYPYTRLCGNPSADMVKTTVGPPAFPPALPRALSKAGAPLRLAPEDPPEVPVPAGAAKGLCNAPLTRLTTVRDRFHYSVAEMVGQGMYVMVDYHPGFRTAGAETILDDLPAWVDAWEDTLARLLAAVPAARGRLMVDLINEPDAFRLSWSAGASSATPAARTPLGAFYLAAIDRLHPICPECLFLVEGGGQDAILGVHWGNGFITDPAVLARGAEWHGGVPPGSAAPFLDEALSRPWAAQLVLSPHIYCPAVSGAVECYSGKCLFDSLRASYGYLTTPPGWCWTDGESGKKKCRVLAAVLGEIGSTLAPGKETECMASVINWINGVGAPGAVAPNASWLYWAWNPDSADVGGLLNPTDWRSVEWPRIHMLTGGFPDSPFPVGLGLRPWYLAGFTGAQPRGKAGAARDGDGGAPATAASTAGGASGRPPAAALALYIALPLVAALVAGTGVYFYRTAKAAAAVAAAEAGAAAGFVGAAAVDSAAEGKAADGGGPQFAVPVFASTAPRRLQALELVAPGVSSGVGTGRSPVSTPRSRRGGGGSPHAPV